MKKTVLSITALAALTIGGVGASAKVKPAKVTPATLKPSSKYLTGKATPSAKVKLSRYGKTFAYGKATKKGNVKIKLRHKLTGGYTYRVTVAKKGYKTKVKYSYVKPVEVKQPIQVINNSVVPAVVPSSTATTTVTTPQTSTQTVAPNGVSVEKMQKWFELQKQIDNLNSQLPSIQAKSDALYDEDDKLSGSIQSLTFESQESLEKSIAGAKATLQEFIEHPEYYSYYDTDAKLEQALQQRKDAVTSAEKSLENYKNLVTDGKNLAYYQKRYDELKALEKLVTAQRDAIASQISELQKQQVEILK